MPRENNGNRNRHLPALARALRALAVLGALVPMAGSAAELRPYELPSQRAPYSRVRQGDLPERPVYPSVEQRFRALSAEDRRRLARGFREDRRRATAGGRTEEARHYETLLQILESLR